MDTFFDMEILAGQSPIFWAACAAVALGLAMIAAAVVVQTRRLGGRLAARTRSRAEATPSIVPVETMVNDVRPEIHEAAEKVRPAISRAEATPVADRLAKLLGRLDHVAERLESADFDARTASQAPEPQPLGESDLKEDSSGVEYVFRAAGG